MTLPTNAAGQTASGTETESGTTTPPVAGTGSQPGTGTNPTETEWQKRAQGWQRAHTEVKTLLDSTVGELNTEKVARTAAEAARAAEAAAKVTAEAEARKAKADLERMQMIVNDFPQLLPFHKDGVLPEGTGEELKEKLTKFASHLQTMVGQKPAGNTNLAGAAGSTPPSPNGQPAGGTVKAEDVKKQAFAAAAAGNKDEYKRLMDQYVSITAKKSE